MPGQVLCQLRLNTNNARWPRDKNIEIRRLTAAKTCWAFTFELKIDKAG